MVKKHRIAIFFDQADGTGSAEYKRIKKSTELTLSFNPETEDFDYIADENPTTEITKYAPSLEQPLKMYENEADFKYFWEKCYNLPTGTAAKVPLRIVFMFCETGSGADAQYKAWKVDCMVSFNEMNGVDSELNFELLFGGTIERGTVKVTGTAPDYLPVFTADSEGGGMDE